MARKKATTAITDNLQLQAIELLSITLNPPAETKGGDVDYLFDIGIEHRVSEVEKLVFVMVSVTVRVDEFPESLGLIVSSCIFQVGNFEEVILPGADGDFHLSKKLVGMINELSISTTRGLMFATFKGTFLHNAILPILNYNYEKSIK